MRKNNMNIQVNFDFTSEDDVDKLHPNIRAYLTKFIKNRIDEYYLLEEEVEKNDFEGVRQVCHKVVGAAPSYRLFKMDEIIKVMQTIARTNENMGEIKALLPIYKEYLFAIETKYSNEEVK